VSIWNVLGPRFQDLVFLKHDFLVGRAQRISETQGFCTKVKWPVGHQQRLKSYMSHSLIISCNTTSMDNRQAVPNIATY